MIIEAGKTLTLETGEYSDFTYHGPFLVLRTMDQAELVGTFREQNPPVFKKFLEPRNKYQVDEEYWIKPDTHDFIAWLTKEGYIEDMEDNYSWFIGSYGRFKPEIV